MKIAGLITEYNPFHNGHLYHIQKAKELTGADYLIVIMSGDFIQRGAPAFLPKDLRARMALCCGASLVIELPVRYATGSAELFAFGAVSLLDQLGCVDFLCFGSECGDVRKLQDLADFFSEESASFKDLLQIFLKAGHSYPSARKEAAAQMLEDSSLCNILNEPNNILGIEYLKALKKRKSTISPITIRRQGAHYHDAIPHEKFSSASAIRKLFLEMGADALSLLDDHVPKKVQNLCEKAYGVRFPVSANDFSLLLKYRLLRESPDSLLKWQDVSAPLANRIVRNREQFQNWEQFCDLLKTRELTYTRISRALLHICLEIPEPDKSVPPFYARILGFQKCAAPLLSLLKQKSSVPLITKLADTSFSSDSADAMLQEDIQSADLYESVITDKFQQPFHNEYRQSLILL